MADPQKCRDEARRLRLDAETVPDVEVRHQMHDLAAQYDELAVSLEAMKKASRKGG
ncbi:MAG: hypothetical protein JWL84_740 [Rhodospirillales bacterium]|jgi:predicted PolB exonuclease-like 3'-5' exonuclease|nr:hypothetical protein [Rhodospirillales bacterium]